MLARATLTVPDDGLHAARRSRRPAHRAPGPHARRDADRRALASGRDVVSARALPSRDELFEILDEVKDPEVPVLSVVELGIVRDATAIGRAASRSRSRRRTPDVRRCTRSSTRSAPRSRRAGSGPSRFGRPTRRRGRPTGSRADGAREARGVRHRAAGPGVEERTSSSRCARASSPLPVLRVDEHRTQSEFGSTACKAIWVCRDCRQPFEEFKAI